MEVPVRKAVTVSREVALAMLLIVGGITVLEGLLYKRLGSNIALWEWADENLGETGHRIFNILLGIVFLTCGYLMSEGMI
jgi:hypothetical protein